jgi:hypothetical protein
MSMIVVVAMLLVADQPQTTTAWIPLEPAKFCVGVKDPALCADLLAITNRDQMVRRKQMADRENKTLQAEVKKVDAENLVQIEAFIKQHGWPTTALVGIKGVGAAWTVIQHSDLEVQKRYIGMMTKAADDGDLEWALVATTIDRIRVREGKPQIYGTQFKEANGAMVPEPIEDEQHVDERRAKVGLQPLAEYKKLIDQFYLRKPVAPSKP